MVKGSLVFEYDSCVLVDKISDHYLCLLLFDMGSYGIKHPGDTIVTSRKLNDKKYLKLNQKLLLHDWSPLQLMDVNTVYNYLIETIDIYLNEVAPLKSFLVTSRELFHEPWMNVQICKYNAKCK